MGKKILGFYWIRSFSFVAMISVMVVYCGEISGELAETLSPSPSPSAVVEETVHVVAVTTLAGSTDAISGSTNGTGTAARFNSPTGIAVDSSGNLYVADTQNHLIRKITAEGVVTTFAGSTIGDSNGTGTAAKFAEPWGVAVDSSGNVYVGDLTNNRIRKITPAGVVTSLAGGNVAPGSADGTGGAAEFVDPRGVAVDSSGNVYVADSGNNLIRKITPVGVVTTLAGSGAAGNADGTGAAATFDSPRGIAVDSSGTLYVTDYFNHRIRKVSPAGVVTTLAGSSEGSTDGTGTGASFSNPDGITVNSAGLIFVADKNNNKIRKITSDGVVTTFAGDQTGGHINGTVTEARFRNPLGIIVDATGGLYIADGANHAIRKIK